MITALILHQREELLISESRSHAVKDRRNEGKQRNSRRQVRENRTGKDTTPSCCVTTSPRDKWVKR